MVIWLIQKDKSPFITHHAKASLNFQISVAIYAIGLAITCIIPFVIFLSALALIGLAIFALVVSIKGAVAANKGEGYSYPLSLDLIK